MLAMSPTEVVADRMHWTHVSAPSPKSAIGDESGPQEWHGMERNAVGKRDELQRLLAGCIRPVRRRVLEIDRRMETLGWGLSSTITRRKLIRPRHEPQRLLHVSGITDGGTEWVAENMAICDRRAIERAITE